MRLDSEDDSVKDSAPSKNKKYVIVSNSTLHNPTHTADISRKLLCIEYPGIVENVDNMLKTLGGMHAIETAVGNQHRRLELRFRPDDIFSKPCWGDKDYNSGILLKITVRRPKSKQNQPSCSKELEPQCTYRYEIIGATTMTFKFSRLCDFQYLPLLPVKKQENQDTPCQNIYEKIVPNKLPDLQWLQSSESSSMPLFFPPPIFSKFNSSKENKLFYERYKYYEKLLPNIAERLKNETQKKQQGPTNVISIARISRKSNSVLVNFYLKDVVIPTEPNEQAVELVKRRALHGEPLETLKRFFEERPIWSKTGLIFRSGISNDHIKLLLPVVGYYCLNGPWRIMWCKFGYDPRKDPSSRIYQTFDYRVRSRDGLKIKVEAKRSYCSTTLHYRAGPASTDKFSLKDCDSLPKVRPKKVVTERNFILKPNMLPPARQMFYQYCDLHLPEIQDMLNRLPDVPKHAKCHIKDGWLPNGFNDQCREIANKYIKVIVKQLLMEEKRKEANEEIEVQKEKHKQTDTKIQENKMNLDTIVIDDDSNDDDEMSSEGDGDSDGSDNSKDDDDEQNDGDIDLEAVDEINKILKNINEETPMQEDKNDSDEEELDPNLIKLYQKLIDTNDDK